MSSAELFQQGLAAYQQGQYAAALESFRELTALYPMMSEAWLNLGNAAFQGDDLGGAEAAWRKAVEINPLEANGYLNLGNLYFKKQLPRRAVQAWEQFKLLRPAHAPLWLNLGLAYEQLGEMDLSLECFTTYLRLESNPRETLRLQTRLKTAREAFDAHIRQAEKALESGRGAQAREAFARAMPLYPGTAQVYKTYAALLYQDGELEGAEAFYLKAYRRQPEDPAPCINLGVIYEKQGRPVDALWAYTEALRQNPPRAAGLQERVQGLAKRKDLLDNYLGDSRAALDAGDIDRAAEMLGRLQTLLPFHAAVQPRLDALLERLAFARDPQYRAGKTYLELAEAAKAQGRYDQAIALYDQYLDALPKGERAAEVRQKREDLKRVLGAVIQTLLAPPPAPQG